MIELTKKILLISYSFPPFYDPQSIRWYNLTKALSEIGYSFDILTVRLPYFSDDKSNKVLESGRVVGIFPGALECVSQKIKSTIKTDAEGNVEKRRKVGFRLAKFGYNLLKTTMNGIFLGDYRTEWLPFVLIFLKKFNLNEYRVLITSQEPFVDGLIGLFIKRKHPDIFWIADIGDPVCAPYNSKLKKPIDEYFEKKIVQRANRVIVTNRNVRLLLSAKYGIPREKIEVITQGFDAERFKAEAEKDVKNERFTMLFSGTFYRCFREPASLIEALYRLKNLNLRLQIAGRNELFLKDFDKIKEKIEFLGFVPYEKSLKLQDKADVLVNISNKQTYQVPGKIYEYIGSRKPILNIVYDEDRDETAWFIKKYRIGVVCENRVEEIKSAVLMLYSAWEKGKLFEMFKFDNSELLEFSWQAGAEKLNRIIEDGVSKE